MDAKPIRLSWSRLRTHTECPAKGQLVSAGHKSPVTDVRNYFPGTVADRCMRQWLSMDEQPAGWMYANVDRILAEEERVAQETKDGVVRWKHPSDKAEVREMCHDAVERLESDLIALLGIGWKPPHEQCGWDPAPRFEVPLTLPHPSGNGTKLRVFLVGEIDLLVMRPEGWVAPAGLEVWDLKTTRDNAYWRKVIGQLVFYEIAMWGLKRQWAVKSGLLQPLCEETMPSWQFTQEHRVQMLQRINTVVGDIWAGRLDPKVGAQCARCEVRHACPVKGGGRGRVAFGVKTA